MTKKGNFYQFHDNFGAEICFLFWVPSSFFFLARVLKIFSFLNGRTTSLCMGIFLDDVSINFWLKLCNYYHLVTICPFIFHYYYFYSIFPNTIHHQQYWKKNSPSLKKNWHTKNYINHRNKIIYSKLL